MTLRLNPEDEKALALLAEAEGVSIERIIDDLLTRIEPPRSEIHV